MLENQTPELFQDVNKPKYNGTLNLDRWAVLPVSIYMIPPVFGPGWTWGSGGDKAMPPVAFSGLAWRGLGPDKVT